MPAPFSVRVFDQQDLRYAVECQGPVILGRDSGGEQPGATYPAPGGTRMVIAAREERSVAREQARIQPTPDGKIRITNLSDKVVIGLADGTPLTPGAWRELPLPAMFTVGPKAIRIQQVGIGEHDAALTGMAEVTAPAGRSLAGLSRFPAFKGTVDPKEFVRWLQSVVGVLQSAAGSDDFFTSAARAAIEIVGLDEAWVRLLDASGEWRPYPPTHAGPPPSRSLLARVYAERRTFWGHPRDVGEAASLSRVQAAVAAPILSASGEVLGVLYGVRWLAPARMEAGAVTELEARLVELLAGAVAAGLARLEEEKQAAAARVRYEEFLTPEVARHLLEKPDLLNGRAAEVSILFADVRGYSSISERLGPEETVRWVGDVLSELSDCVQAQGGVLVDYIGDELMAMWGAPADQPDHAVRACRAAQNMLARLPALDARWRSTTGETLELGVGVHTGMAHVGNVGTRHKFKYGPLGPTSNLASRVQGATKFLQVPLLVTGATRRKLGDEFATRRLTKAKVVNIAEPVELVELIAAPPMGWTDRRDAYEAALSDFEAGRLHDATRRLGPMLAAHPDDGPALLLLTRAVQALQPNAPPFDPVWVLPGK